MPWIALVGLACLAVVSPCARGDDAALDERLRAESPAALVAAARAQGDARQGAVLFHRPALQCARCHDVGGDRHDLAPDLARPRPGTTPESLVESILDPSKAIHPGYETVTIATRDGRVIAGVHPESRGDALVLRDPARPGEVVTIPHDQIEARRDGGESIMPAGLVNALHDRHEFLDLARYVIEVSEGGPARALALKPGELELAPPPLPAFEHDLDHAGLLAALDEESLKRGAAIYRRVCANCHGTPERLGSLPQSPRFWLDALKTGGDPYRLYRVLTDGSGQMPPQTWMVPRQKYDVIHYLREQFFKPRNPTQYVAIDASYLAGLPKGTQRGPEPSAVEPWAAADYGPTLTATYEVGAGSGVFAYKGIAVRLDDGPGGIARGRHFVVYDHDTLRLAGAWSGEGFIDWDCIHFNGRHEVHPATVGRVHLTMPNEPGWLHPGDPNSPDSRVRGRDGIAYGPLPRDWAHFRGRYQHGSKVILSYTVGEASALESPGLEWIDGNPEHPVFTRTIEIAGSPHDLVLCAGPDRIAVAIAGDDRPTLSRHDGRAFVRIPRSATPTLFKLLLADGDPLALDAHARSAPAPEPLAPRTHGGAPLWTEVVTARATVGADDGPFAVDVLAVPESNPWRVLFRPTGFDFLDGGRAAAVCTWDGDVWRVDGLAEPGGTLTWRRIALGLFQPLGLLVRDGAILVGCRDQIVALRDRNGDGETDFYENINSDHQVTEHFHEFAMGLQADADGNLYYAKAARHALPALVPQHGTLLRVSADGARTDILARGFRAPNGVCLNPDGTFFLTDQEGHWIPKNRLNWIDRPGKFYGNMWAYSDVTDTSDAAMEPPVCWITNAFDRSPAEPLWVTSAKWGALQGSLLSLSYGYGEIFVAPYEVVGGRMQGGMARLPIERFPTGLVRGRFSPLDGQLYVCGMYAWAGHQTLPGGFFRVRATGHPARVPIALHARAAGLAVTFTDPLDPATAGDPARYAVKTWSLRRSQNYGSPHEDERERPVRAASVSDDGRTVTLDVPGLGPTWCYELRFDVRGRDGAPVIGTVHGTIHRVPD